MTIGNPCDNNLHSTRFACNSCLSFPLKSEQNLMKSELVKKTKKIES